MAGRSGMKTINNNCGLIEVKLDESIKWICLGGPATASLEITYVPNNTIYEYIDLHNWLVNSEWNTDPSNPRILEEVVAVIWAKLTEIAQPAYLKLIAHAMGGKHGPLTVIKEDE